MNMKGMMLLTTTKILVSIGFLTLTMHLLQKFLPNDLECSSSHQLERTVIFFHVEPVFTENKDQKLQWGSADMHVIWPKGKEARIMVSDYIDEQNG